MRVYNFFGISIAEFTNEKSKSYKVSKSYKDKTTNEWKKTDYFYADDLLKLRAAIDKVINDSVNVKEIADKGQQNNDPDPWGNA